MNGKKKILVVDDERAICESVRKILLRRGYHVDYSLDGGEALGKVGRVPYNLIILDIMMPKIGGIELLRLVRQRYRECNVIMITGYASVDTAVTTTRLGAMAYVSKPFTPEELLKVVDDVLRSNPRSGDFCEKGRMDCKKYVKTGACKDECPIREKSRKVGGGKKAESKRSETIDVDIPFDFDEVERATSTMYAETMSNSDIPILGWQKYYAQNNRILIVDDEVVVCNSIRKIVAMRGYEVDSAVNGAEALRKMGEKEYGLVLLDLKLPDVSGMELLKQIRSKWPETEVVIVTGYASIDTAVETTQLGAISYIPKPFTPEELQKTVDYAMSWKAA